MEEFIGILLVIAGVVAYCGAVILFFIYVVPVIAGVAGLAALGFMLNDHGQALAAHLRTTPRVPEKPEPAIKQYFYSAAWTELKSSARAGYEAATGRTRRAASQLSGIISGEPTVVMGPLGAGLYVALGVAIVIGFALFGVTLSLHALILSVVLLITGAVAYTLRGFEMISMLVRRIYLVCPNRDCHRPIALPLYRCPKCGAEHHALLPGSYGTVKRRCQCGEWLPTLFLFGRSSVPAFCPHPSCRKPLSDAIGSARNVHIPVVGGAYVGKTAFLTATMIEVGKKSNIEMTFPEKADQSAFDAASRRFERGVPVDKTAGASPNAMLLKIKDTHHSQSLVYIYDAAGELYGGTTDLGRQNFFEHTSAIALLVDPLSLTQVRTDHARDLSAFSAQLRASDEPASNVYARMMMTLREQRGDKERMSLPLAIVVTKVDAIGIDKEIRALQPVLTTPDVTGEQRYGLGVREWLIKNGEGNLVRSAERDFKRVGFFACSALGRMPTSSTAAFVPQGVLTPFEWLTGSAGVRLL